MRITRSCFQSLRDTGGGGRQWSQSPHSARSTAVELNTSALLQPVWRSFQKPPFEDRGSIWVIANWKNVTKYIFNIQNREQKGYKRYKLQSWNKWVKWMRSRTQGTPSVILQWHCPVTAGDSAHHGKCRGMYRIVQCLRCWPETNATLHVKCSSIKKVKNKAETILSDSISLTASSKQLFMNLWILSRRKCQR